MTAPAYTLRGASRGRTRIASARFTRLPSKPPRSLRGLPQAVTHNVTKRALRGCPTKNPCVTPLPFGQNRESLQQPPKPPPCAELYPFQTTLPQPRLAVLYVSPSTRYDPLAAPYHTASGSCITLHATAACRKRLRLALTRESVPPLTTVSHISTAVQYHNFIAVLYRTSCTLYQPHHGPVSHFTAVLYHTSCNMV